VVENDIKEGAFQISILRNYGIIKSSSKTNAKDGVTLGCKNDK